MSSETYSDSVTRVLALMERTFGTTFKKYFDDDPGAIPAFDLPCVVVTELNDVTEGAAFGQDDVTETIMIKLVFNKRDGYANDKVEEVVFNQREIREMVGARDPVTGRFLDRTVKGAIRQYVTEGVTSVSEAMTTEYGVAPRSNGVTTLEAHVTFTLRYSVDIVEHE
ncbi:hypothetical protein Q0F99_19115 [Rathayibacter oskolensis]|uniref:hypothetical protein n=1 Tax=Rathayibacter oskolensis TaxID=1891671 RepID=UPI00265EBA33|nr:hypothetical protein [Rathayibacter oskolensis]WKK71451.1 hypothetical protein Q0F99_19115 [Rathayibacter oskolensis]